MDGISETRASNNDKAPSSGGTHNVSQTSVDEERRERGTEELTLSHTDTFNADRVPTLPIATLLDKIPRYRSDSTGSDDTTVNTSITASTITSALIDYPRTEEGIDFRTMGNQNAARLLEEYTCNMKLHNVS
ncbi:PREDICTED: uncharacterized protein LOC109593566 isoform X1 [Amphimedon queenslandica]|uniref:Uncharacterized protein n=1 Tax=Amphimedon queenslandica TaxID=400682 RepID=A0AAN0K3P9_AMPQE|nr:PREDICTED: uncharacterized protein LOC109593566 isoform X1 [Amphimedon queenslandica]|eukprot:XP_019864153.1 PREDICTED: uncharacterized protein LOC109593566 isoform X1 [Amphimedon queenslandica]